MTLDSVENSVKRVSPSDITCVRIRRLIREPFAKELVCFSQITSLAGLLKIFAMAVSTIAAVIGTPDWW